MFSFFYHSAQILMSKYQDRFSLLKITQTLDWQSIESLLNKRKIQYLRDHGGRISHLADVSRHFVRASIHKNDKISLRLGNPTQQT